MEVEGSDSDAAAWEPVAVVMAAGKSTRMRSQFPKVLHELCGQPLLAYVLDALKEAGIQRQVLIVGYQAALVQEAFADRPGVEFALQAEQRGTGHAVRCAEPLLRDHRGPIVVLAGDGPLIRAELLRQMLQEYQSHQAQALLATAVVEDPTGLGRIVRDETGHFLRIVEHKDASPAERLIREINPSFYVFDGPSLFSALAQVQPNNAQGEYYITDVPALLLAAGKRVFAKSLASAEDMFGVNDRSQLATAHTLLQQRIHAKHFANGVTIVDSRNTYIDVRAQIGPESVILPFTVLEGAVTIGSHCRVGPFAHISDQTVLADRVEVGAFVQIRRSQIQTGTKAKHLAYLGDAQIGSEVNVGAGVITANFDGQQKHQTTVADHAFLGSGSVLIAPVHIGTGAIVGAGAVVPKNHDVPDHTTVVGVPAQPLPEKKNPA